jgi:hypothetical protein
MPQCYQGSHPNCLTYSFGPIRVLEVFLNCKSWAELARFIAPMPVRVNEKSTVKPWLARMTAG